MLTSVAPREPRLLGDELADQPGCDQVHPVEQGAQQPFARALGCWPALVPVGEAGLQLRVLARRHLHDHEQTLVRADTPDARLGRGR